jgi:hypothetical protein
MTTDNSTVVARAPRIKDARLTTKAEQLKIDRYVASSVPEKHKLATRRALMGQIARSTAIRVKCLQCCGYQRDEIKQCLVITCALYPVRPYQDSNEEAMGSDE